MGGRGKGTAPGGEQNIPSSKLLVVPVNCTELYKPVSEGVEPCLTTRASAHLDLSAEFERIDQRLEEEWAASPLQALEEK